MSRAFPNYGMPPCKDCEKRHIACHDKCEDFAEYKKKVRIAKDKEFAEKVVSRMRPTAPKRGGKK